MRDVGRIKAGAATVSLVCLLLLVAGCSQTAEQAHPTAQVDAAGTDQGMKGEREATESKSAVGSADGAGNANSASGEAGNGEEQESELPEGDGSVLRHTNPDGSVNDLHLPSQSAGTADEAKTRKYLKLLALQYFSFVQKNGAGPGNWQQLGRESEEVDSLIELQRLGYDVAWGVPQVEVKPQSILAYPTDAAKSGGIVALMDGTVEPMSAEEFQTKWGQERGAASGELAAEEGPGVGPVLANTELVAGDKLLGRWGAGWFDVEVLAVLPGDRVKIHYDGFSDSWDEAVERNRLRLKTQPIANGDAGKAAEQPLEVDYRIWTNPDGDYQVDAQLRRIDEDRQLAFLKKREGRIVAIPIYKLSDDDQEHIREAQAKATIEGNQ